MSKKLKMVAVDLPFTVFSYEADHDYLLARWIWFAGGGFHTRAGFFAQQACEKYMKSVLVQAAGQYPETHQLLKIAEECAKHHVIFADAKAVADLAKFDAYEQVGRYGGAAKHDPLAVNTPGLQTAGVSFWDETYLQALDRFAFNTRRLLDYTKVSFNDSLVSILRRDGKCSMEGTWQGQPSIFEILTKENPYFRPLDPQ